MLKKLESLIGKYQSYPYIHTHSEFIIDKKPIRFHIKNPVERFRLQKWGWEKELIVDAVNLAKKGDIFFDIGASVGALSIPVAQKINPGQLFSFEPDPENTESLRNNFLLNEIENFEIIPCAVGDKEGELELFTQGSNGFSPSLRKVNGIEHSIKVKIVTIDGLIAAGKIPKPNIVKIDIEGAEMMCLKGMQNLLSGQDKPRLIILEIHPKFLPVFDTNITEIFRFLLEKGYQIDHLETRGDQMLCKVVA